MWRRAELARGLWQPQGVEGASLLEAPTYGKAMLMSHSTLEGKGGEKGINLPAKKQLPAPTVLPPRKNISQSKERKIPRVFLAYPWAPATGIGAVPRVYILLLVWTPEDFPASQGLRDICLSAPGVTERLPTYRLFLRYSCSAFSATVSINLGLSLETSSGNTTVMGSESKSFTTTSVTREGTSESEEWVVT